VRRRIQNGKRKRSTPDYSSERGDEPTAAGEARYPPPLLESGNPAMSRAIERARRAAAFDVPILLTGESGSGKHTLAMAIHHWSRRRAGPFVTIRLQVGNPGETMRPRGDAWQRTVRHLHTAHLGTAFFADVGTLSPALQSRLLGVIDQLPRERGEEPTNPDVRVIAASDRDLDEDVQTGRFRADLFYRLSVLRIHVPALRERLEDLSRLVARILERICLRYGRGLVEIEPDVLLIFARHRWPGNVRELVSVLERAIALAPGPVLLQSHLPDYLVAAGV